MSYDIPPVSFLQKRWQQNNNANGLEKSLRDNNIIGMLPNRIGQLSRLEKPDLSVNDITGCIPHGEPC